MHMPNLLLGVPKEKASKQRRYFYFQTQVTVIYFRSSEGCVLPYFPKPNSKSNLRELRREQRRNRSSSITEENMDTGSILDVMRKNYDIGMKFEYFI